MLSAGHIPETKENERMAQQQPPVKIKLICIPYAGGSSGCFSPLRAHFPPFVELAELSLPGRGRRYDEPLLDTAESMTDDLWQQLRPMTGGPYALLGHSMGSLLCWLLCHRLVSSGSRLPEHVFLSGREGPSVPHKEPFEHRLPYADFKAKLEGYGGIAEEITKDDDIFSFFEPMIRADFRATELWTHDGSYAKLPLPATVFSATGEDSTEEEVHAWQHEFTGAVSFERFEGSHFFLFEQASTFAERVVSRLVRSRE